MKRKFQVGLAAMLVGAFVLGFVPVAAGQWVAGQQVASPLPKYGTYYSMRLGANSAPLPALPPSFDGAVFFVGTFDGINVFCFDDRDQAPAGRSTQQNSDSPLPDGDYRDGGWGGYTTYPPAKDYNCGTNLFIMIGPAGANQAWLAASNTHYLTFYQLESRTSLDPAAQWILGPIVQDTQGTNRVGFGNVRTDYPSQTYFRAVAGNTVASIALDPDYNLAVKPASPGGSPQIGKFHIALSPASSGATVVYQVSGSASNGVDYTSLGGSVTVSSSGSAEIDVQPLYHNLPEFDESVTLTLVPHTNGYLVDPKFASATLKIYDPRPAGMAVAIHDSGWTKINGLSGTNWNYFVMPESVKEALRSDGTPYVVLSDLDIANGLLLTTNGTPKYPILISLAAEVIRDEEIAPLANYVAAGGFVLAGSSSFTRGTNGGFRSNFALASQMGLSCTPSTNNWVYNYNLYKAADHHLVNDIPTNGVVWRMPTSSDEVSFGSCLDNHNYSAPHPIWQVTNGYNSGVQVLAWGDTYPYLTVNQYGSGQFIYDAALQPLLGHGGFCPGMYAYIIFRRAIEWAFQSAQRPVVKVRPWPYQYDAAFMVRHDLENYWDEVADVATSAYIEFTNGAKGDYYFCTGAITDQVSFASIVTGLQQAVGSYGATIGSHNGGLPNPRLVSDTNSSCYAGTDDYIYFHWGPDEALDVPFGYAYASNSVAISFAQIDTWLTNQVTSPRVWVAPYFNATREQCYEIQEQLNVRISGDQKLTPFPTFTLSTQTDGKRYAILSEPVSDWFVNGAVAQSLDPWHPPAFTPLRPCMTAWTFFMPMGS